MALYQDAVVVSAVRDDNNGVKSGSAHVFIQTGDKWTHHAKLLAPDRAAGDNFGENMTIYKDTVVVGAIWDSNYGDLSGSLYVF